MFGSGTSSPRGRRDPGVTPLTQADLRPPSEASERGPDSDPVPFQESPS